MNGCDTPEYIVDQVFEFEAISEREIVMPDDGRGIPHYFNLNNDFMEHFELVVESKYQMGKVYQNKTGTKPDGLSEEQPLLVFDGDLCRWLMTTPSKLTDDDWKYLSKFVLVEAS